MRRARPRADLLSLLLIAAACACLWLGYANVYDAVAVFARERAEPETVTLLLPAQQWYVVREDGRTVAACASLIEAEIARDARASATEIAALKAESIELRVTAEKRCAEALEEAAAAVERTLSALKWARLYGGAAGLLLIDGQEDHLDAPLDLAEIQPGQFRGVWVCDRFSGVTPSAETVSDLSDPDFGLPERYEFQSFGAQGARYNVHHSRVLRFVSRELPAQEQAAECFWGASELEHVFDELATRRAPTSPS